MRLYHHVENKIYTLQLLTQAHDCKKKSKYYWILMKSWVEVLDL